MAETVLVTGGAGFVGSHLVDRLLDDGHRVVVVDDLSTGRPGNLADARERHGGALVELVLDITRDDLGPALDEHRPSVVFHLAAQMSVAVSVERPVHDAVVNVAGTVAVLEAARRHGVRKVVFASSGGAIYGDVPPERLPHAEDAPGPGLSPYGAAKRCGEEYLATYEQLYGLAWTAIAPGNIYGPRQDPAGEGGVIARFTQRLVDGEPCVIHGDGEQTRDYVYVGDVVGAMAAAGWAGDGQRVNIGTGRATSVNKLYDALARLCGVASPAEHGPPRPGDVRHSVLAIDRAEAALGWQPRVSLDEGLARTLAWQRGEG